MATAVRPQASDRTVAAQVPAPIPRRVRPPRWLDLRLVLGVLLVLGSVLLGARVVMAADATAPVWSAATDLAAGTVLEAGDLVPVDVRLDAAARGYLSAGTRPVGRTLSRSVGSGELLPRAALAESAELVQVALPVRAGYVPPGLRRGQLIDVYAVADPAAGEPGAPDAVVRLVVAETPVQAVSGQAGGVLNTPTTTVQVVVSVAADAADDVLAAVGGRPLVVVVHDAVTDGAGTPRLGSGPSVGSSGAAPSGGSSGAEPAGQAGD